MRASAEPAAVKAKEIEGDGQGNLSRITRLMKSNSASKRDSTGG